MSIKQKLHRLNARWLRYEYKHTSFAILLILLFVLTFDSAIMIMLFGFIESLGYAGVFIAGVLSVSFFTAVPALVLLVDMANDFDPFALSVVAAAGAMIGDWLLMIFLQDKITDELRPLSARLHLAGIGRRLRSKYTRWLLFVAGALIISTPLPDELGIALLGISHFKKAYLLAVCFVLNALGFLALVGVVRILS